MGWISDSGPVWKIIVSPPVLFSIVFVVVWIWLVIKAPKRKYKCHPFGDKGAADYFSTPHKFKTPSKRVNKSEEKCREIFERLFGRPFPSVRPNWLQNPNTKRNLEIDGFCESIRTPIGQGLGFEYDGVQHAEFNSHFHGNDPKKFVYQRRKDRFKSLVCRSRGVLLIRIPHYIGSMDLETFIVKELKKNGVHV